MLVAFYGIIVGVAQDRARNDHREPGFSHRSRHGGFRPHGRPARARDPASAGAASARLHPRGPAHGAGVPEATRLIAAMGQRTTDSHNEVVLMAGSLGC